NTALNERPLRRIKKNAEPGRSQKTRNQLANNHWTNLLLSTNFGNCLAAVMLTTTFGKCLAACGTSDKIREANNTRYAPDKFRQAPHPRQLQHRNSPQRSTAVPLSIPSASTPPQRSPNAPQCLAQANSIARARVPQNLRIPIQKQKSRLRRRQWQRRLRRPRHLSIPRQRGARQLNPERRL